MSKGYEIADLPIDQVDNNAGQIPGLPKNPRYIRNDRYEALLKSIKDFPEMLHLREILVIEHDGRYVAIGGNMRLIACRELEHETIPCKILSPDTPVERLREITIKDNNVCGAYDDDILANEWNLDELIDWGLELTNEFAGLDDEDEYDDDEDEYEGDENVEVVEDEPPNITSDKCRKGDIWQLGQHRLICGDSTEPETLERLMNGETADIVLTDPPYNVNYKEKEKDLLEHRPNKRVEEGNAVDIANDAMEENEFIVFLTHSFTNFKDHLKDGGAFYIWHSATHAFEFISACRQAGLQVRQSLIWNKNHFVLGRSDYQYKHEPCLYGWKDGASHYFVGDRTQSTVYEDAGFEPSKMSKQELVELVTNLVVNNVATDVINENKPVVSELHPTMKPVKLFGRLLKNSSIPGDICLDPFCGSGTSIIACEQLARKCYASELSVDYCNTIITRWEEFAHEKAELISRINN